MTSFLLASFRAETEDEGEQIRLALSEPGAPTRWAELAGGRPGKPELERGEGPAVFVDPDSGFTYVLVDEFALRGYQLFRTLDPGTDAWEHVADARLPAGARHGSVLAVTEAERRTLAGLR